MRKRISLVSALILTCGWVYAERDRAHPSPISTFVDDRNVELVNTNFKELEGFTIDKSSYNAVVPSASSVSTITFVVPLRDTDYGVFVQTSWNAAARVLQKTTTGFMIEYTVPAATGKSLDWIVTR